MDVDNENIADTVHLLHTSPLLFDTSRIYMDHLVFCFRHAPVRDQRRGRARTLAQLFCDSLRQRGAVSGAPNWALAHPSGFW